MDGKENVARWIERKSSRLLGLAPISSWQVNIKEMLRSIPTISAARRF
jgi:hypothetical protein